MWKGRSTLIAPLTEISGRNSTFEWSERQEKAFHAIKAKVAEEALLTYPDFNKPFELHTDASDYQLGGVVSQDGKPIAFYSRKLNPAQKNYTTTEKELLAITETLKEYKNYY